MTSPEFTYESVKSYLIIVNMKPANIWYTKQL